MAGLKNNRNVVRLCLALAVVTLLVYLPVTRNGFVNFDDTIYITGNPHVNAGLTWPGIVWALRFTGYANNWHPLTWMTHMLDCQLYGLNPAGHHLTNILLHTADSVLLLLLLYQMTGALCRSALVAALFAWHPLHVESVAWASERKDVLSTLFWLLTMMAYVRYTRERGKGNPRRKLYYVLALLCFVLGLMSKPMLVTLPCVLLLVDFWPLDRIYNSKGEAERANLIKLIFEKTPFFLLALGSSIITYRVQQASGAMSSFEDIPLPLRAGTAVQSYVQYLSMTLWPAKLAVFYPYPKQHSPAMTIVCGGLLVVISALFLLAARRRPYLVTGWFWYLGTLVPTIGLVQVGTQAMADRYMYIPSIGLFLVFVWGLNDILADLPRRRELLGAAGAIALAGCLALTWIQIQYWHDTLKLFSHAIEATTDNYVAYNGYGGALDEAGEPGKAMLCYEKAVAISPRYPEGLYNLGTALLNQGRTEEAVVQLKAALSVNPDYMFAHNNLGRAFQILGRLDDAASELKRTVELQPDFAQSHRNLGTVLLAQGELDSAIAEFSEAVRLNPHEPGLHASLGVALLQRNRLDDAATEFNAVLELTPNDAAAHINLAQTLARQHKTKESAGHYREALRLNPDSADALYRLAWMLSTCSDPQSRNGREGVQLAQKACDLTQYQQAYPVLTLAAALAETGQFSEATAKAQQALGLANAAGQRQTVTLIETLLKLFQSGQPFHEAN